MEDKIVQQFQSIHEKYTSMREERIQSRQEIANNLEILKGLKSDFPVSEDASEIEASLIKGLPKFGVALCQWLFDITDDGDKD